MHILERVDGYIEQIKQSPYVYKMQMPGIELFKSYIVASGLDIREEDFHAQLVDKLLLVWLPRNRKYLGETQVYQMIYTIQDLVSYICKSASEDKPQQEAAQTSDENAILQLYGQEYMRVYKAKTLLQQMTNDPVISVEPIVVDLDKYKNKKKKNSYSELATTYEQAFFEVQTCKEGGQVILNKIGQVKPYKLLLDYPVYKYLKKGDILHAVIKRKLFYVYWEIDEIKGYYLPQALAFFNLS